MKHGHQRHVWNWITMWCDPIFLIKHLSWVLISILMLVTILFLWTIKTPFIGKMFVYIYEISSFVHENCFLHGVQIRLSQGIDGEVPSHNSKVLKNLDFFYIFAEARDFSVQIWWHSKLTYKCWFCWKICDHLSTGVVLNHQKCVANVNN